MPFTSINPSTGQPLKTYQAISSGDMDQKIKKGYQTFLNWGRLSMAERGIHLKKIADQLDQSKERLAHLMNKEMGKSLDQGLGEIEKCAWACRYYADHAEGYLKPEIIQTDAKKSYVIYQPLGVIFGIMPWNFPFWQVFRFVVPTLMAGNTIVIKHAPNVCGCALAIEEVVQKAGLPEGVLQVLLISEDQAKEVIHHPLVRAVTLTGSARAGRAVVAEAGAALKKVVLELGGSDPYVVLDDADLEEAATICVSSRLNNVGQVCISAKRFIVTGKNEKEFIDLVIQKMKVFHLGPMAREDLRDNLHRQVTETVRQGASCLMGGTIPKGPGYFYPPTVLTGVKKGMPAYDEEIFGPVAVILSAENEEKAIELANDTSYGLGAAVFTRDEKKGEEIAAHKFQAGACFVNSMVKSDPRLPFGGIKNSGFGRELGAIGIREFMNIKTVYIK